MKLAFGLGFNDLYERAGLLRVDQAFLAFLGEADRVLLDKLTFSRTTPPAGKHESDLLVALAPHFEDFIGRLFGIETGTVHRWKEPADPHPSGVRKKGRKTDEI